MTHGDVAPPAPVNRREHLRYALVGLGSAAYLYPFVRVLWLAVTAGVLAGVAQFQEVISALERRKVRYVLWDTLVDGQNLKQWFPEYRQPPREKLVIEPYLTAHYDLIGIKNGFRVLRRKDAMLATRAQPAADPGL
jgi:hypothetical protein